MLRQKKERDAKIQELNRKYKQEKEAYTQLKQVYHPKLKETIGFYQEIKKQTAEIKEDALLLPEMF